MSDEDDWVDGLCWDPDCDDECEEDYDWDYYDAIYQESIIQEGIYSGKLLISEIRQQENRMVVLATSYMLIADIDCGDDIVKPLKILENFVLENGGCFRVYKTKNGMRYLQTDLPYQGANKSAIATLKALGSDPQYVELCDRGKQFMARLTPKIEPDLALKYFEDRKNFFEPDMAVCHYLLSVGKRETSPMLDQTIDLHDLLTQCDHTKFPLK